MVKPLSKRQLQAETRRHITKRTYEEEGSAGVVHKISESDRSKEILRKVPRLHPLESAGEDSLRPSADCPALDDGDTYMTQNMCEKEQTQTRQVIESFVDHMDKLEDLVMEHYTNPFANERCICGRENRLIRCNECFQHSTSCRQCFIEQHRSLPFHWALVWSVDLGHFEKCDYTFLAADGLSVQLGHGDGTERCPGTISDSIVNVVHTNGIHGTKIRFCGCIGAEDHVTQLMRARLFPGTLKKPQTLFTFTVLKDFSMHNIQSKCGAFDYMMSLRRLTDNVFLEKVPDPYKSLLRVTRIWEHLTLNRRVGQLHDIDKYIPHRPPGNVVVYCPACPEPGVNFNGGYSPVPNELRHLQSLFLTIDGNHRCNRHKKNTDPNDRSLWNGGGYFPGQEYQDYLYGTPVETEKSVCSYINAVNGQDRKKFIGNDETGLINVQCTHVCVLSSTDMYLGERFAYTDFALKRAFELRPLTDLYVDIAYDSACSYSVNVAKRFAEHRELSNHTDTIKRSRFTIDALHVNDHKDKCMYLYAACYKVGIGHFHAVGTEQYWSENNQLGPQTRQMNKGHRQDKITVHHADWNWKKVTRIAMATLKQLITARDLYVEKKEFFRQLCRLHLPNVPIWLSMDREPTIERNGSVRSVYRHFTQKLPSLDRLQASLLQNADHPEGIGIAQTAYYLTEGIRLEEKQLKVRMLIVENTQHPLAATHHQIADIRRYLVKAVDDWRKCQAIHSNASRSDVLSHPTLEIEELTLFLPSHYSAGRREELGLQELGFEEVKLREAQACDLVLQLRRAVKTISAARGAKKKNDTGQQQLTRSAGKIQTMEFARDLLLETYKLCRRALISLEGENDVNRRFPPLSLNDLHRKPTISKRERGDSHRSEGGLWVTFGDSKYSTTDDPFLCVLDHDAAMENSGEATLTQMTRRQGTGSRRTQRTPAVEMQAPEDGSPAKSASKPDHTIARPQGGRLWQPIADQEIIAWEIEEDRVQLHRAWADMLRWVEELELKHLDFIRIINYFDAMSIMWAKMAGDCNKPGYSAFARKQSNMFGALRNQAKARYQSVASSVFLHSDESTFVIDVTKFREDQFSWLNRLINNSEGLSVC